MIQSRLTMAVVETLLDDEDELADDPKQWTAVKSKDWDMIPLQRQLEKIPGGERQGGDGHEDQWHFTYKNWLFAVSTYEDGTQIWSAHYPTPLYSWSTVEDRQRGYGLSTGEQIKLPKGYNPGFYLKKLRAMVDSVPDPFKLRQVPKMPSPHGR